MSGGKKHAGAPRMGAVTSREGDRVTTLELFFNLAFVFAFTQLSRLMAQHHDALGILQALVVLALLWWAWTAYGWLTNIAHADQGVVRVAMIIGMTAVFVAGIVVVEAYDDLPGGLFGPLVFVGAYLVARITHAVVFVWLAEPALRRRTLLTVTLSSSPPAPCSSSEQCSALRGRSGARSRQSRSNRSSPIGPAWASPGPCGPPRISPNGTD